MSDGTHATAPREVTQRRLRGSHPLRPPVPAVFGCSVTPTRAPGRALRAVRSSPLPATPTRSSASRVWAPPRSLAATEGILSFPRGTEMFQFPRCPPGRPGARPVAGRVAPFGNPWITSCQRLPRAFRGVAASFFGRTRLGIHHAPIIADGGSSTASRSHQGPRAAARPASHHRLPPRETMRSRPPQRAISSARGHRRQTSSRAPFACQCAPASRGGGAAGIRTPDLRRAKAALSRLSYGPHASARPVGAPGLEPGTSALSGPRSDHLSYAPALVMRVVDPSGALRRAAEDGVSSHAGRPGSNRLPTLPGVPARGSTGRPGSPRNWCPVGTAPHLFARPSGLLPRKEVIQPQLPLRLPCYDFVPITNPTLNGCLPCGLAHRLQVLPAFVT